MEGGCWVREGSMAREGANEFGMFVMGIKTGRCGSGLEVRWMCAGGGGGGGGVGGGGGGGMRNNFTQNKIHSRNFRKV